MQFDGLQNRRDTEMTDQTVVASDSLIIGKESFSDMEMDDFTKMQQRKQSRRRSDIKDTIKKTNKKIKEHEPINAKLQDSVIVHDFMMDKVAQQYEFIHR